VDAIDRRLIELLTEYGRLSYAELARQVGLSAPAVKERCDKLESSRVIRSYRAHLDPEAVGLGVTAFIGIVQAPGSEIDEVEIALRGRPEIESCYFLAGTESYLIQVRVATIADLERLIVALNRIPGVANTRTMIALSTKWESRPFALPPSD
jgi:Lrp/AsnC family leucine-responsive transcriptional regulator